MSAKPRVGFIGLGLMGGPIAQKLLENGYDLSIWGRSTERQAPFIEQGAAAMPAPAALAEACDVVVLCVSDTAAMEATHLAEKSGVDVLALPGALAGGRGDSNLLQEYLPHMAKRDYTPRARISILLKDLDLVADLARANGASMPLAMLARELNRVLVAQGLGEKDNAAFMELFGG